MSVEVVDAEGARKPIRLGDPLRIVAIPAPPEQKGERVGPGFEVWGHPLDVCTLLASENCEAVLTQLVFEEVVKVLKDQGISEEKILEVLAEELEE